MPSDSRVIEKEKGGPMNDLYNHYAYLSTRFRKSPMFLPRNLSYRRRLRERSQARRKVASLKKKLQEERDSVKRPVSFQFVLCLMNIGNRGRLSINHSNSTREKKNK